jgi:hypothetical protein
VKALCLILALLLSGCSAGFTLSVAGAADVATTHYALGQGFHEANPIFDGASVQTMIIAKMAVTGLLIWICHWLDGNGHHGLSNVLQWGGTAAWGGAALWNIHKVRQ